MEPYRSDYNCSLGTAPKTVHSQLQRGSVTGDGYLEITPVVGTDVRVSPNNYVQGRYHRGYHRQIAKGPPAFRVYSTKKRAAFAVYYI